MMTQGNSCAVARSVAELRAQVRDWRAAGLTVALVPTMGALHAGHMSLVRLALTKADRVVVSVFVNPTQFGPTEDFSAYPRQPEQDSAAIAAAGGHLVYLPTVAEMYPEGASTMVEVSGVSAGLCGDARPGHFRGVATIVTKLLLQALPDVAVFGEKDFQQLMVIRRLVRDLDIPVEVIGAPIVREADGLAMSSRNAYLSAEERPVAARIHAILTETAGALAGGRPVTEACAAATAALLDSGFRAVDYLELRDAETLTPVTELTRPARLFVAAFLGRTRLIDNIGVQP
ncbi:pantoate--beta-alanine ligase [Novispirillum itersonii]|uniref:pantoate--beta-alanine ligase n=1 Tax=Novispirillum itersonii TaxID=189 RepID=UPI00160A2AF6|nr:pantoate--beta-alanine ligase [Novispirillum itersonii]